MIIKDATKENHNQYVLEFVCLLRNQRFGKEDLLVLILYKKLWNMAVDKRHWIKIVHHPQGKFLLIF